MPSPAVDTAIKTRLHQSWSASPVVGGLGANDLPETLTEPPSVPAFLVVQYPVVNGSKPVINGKYFEDGAIRLVLNVKSEIGITQGLVWGDALAGLFREYHDAGGGFQTFTPSAPIVDNNLDDGNWLSFAVIVPYRYQFNG